MKTQLQEVYDTKVVNTPIEQQKQHAGFIQYLYVDIMLDDDAVRATSPTQKQAHSRKTMT